MTDIEMAAEMHAARIAELQYELHRRASRGELTPRMEVDLQAQLAALRATR